MKQFILRQRKTTIGKAISSGSILSLFIYGIFRCLFLEFPMTIGEELLFFAKTVLLSCFLIATATGGAAWLYRHIKKMQR